MKHGFAVLALVLTGCTLFADTEIDLRDGGSTPADAGADAGANEDAGEDASSCVRQASCVAACGTLDDGCGGAVECDPCVATTITITPDPIIIEVRQSAPVTVVVLDQTGRPLAAEPELVIGDEGIAAFESGEVRGLAIGSTQLIATAGEVTADAAIRVVEAPPGNIDRIELSPASLSLEVGDAEVLVAVAYDRNDTIVAADIEWEVDEPSSLELTPSADGSQAGIRAFSPRTATVTARVGVLVDTATITIEGSSETFAGVVGAEAHFCGWTTSGNAYCWGAGKDGELGDARSVDNAFATQVSMTGVVEMFAGFGGTCATDATGLASCWGDVANLRSSAPQALSAGAVSDISIGRSHACLVDATDAIQCWGENSSYQSGSGTTADFFTTQTPIDSSLQFGDVAAGFSHTCATTAAMTVACWGNNTYRQSGVDRLNPPAGISNGSVVDTVYELPTVASVSRVFDGNFTTCAQKLDGSVVCWGALFWLGLSTHLPSGTLFVGAVDALGLGWSVVCALQGGEITCAGLNDRFGLNGDGPDISDVGKAAHPDGRDWVDVASGGGASCAIDDLGHVYCWGYRGFGQIGDGRDSWTETPSPARGLSDLEKIVAGGEFACGISPASGAAHCWGDNASGQLGDGSSDPGRPLIAAVSGGRSFSTLAAGLAHACGIETTTQQAFCWGDGQSGQLGNGLTDDQSAPVAVSGGHAFVDLAAGRDHTCGVTTTGELYCWGGEFGAGTPSSTAILVDDGTLGIESIDAAQDATCGLDGAGTAYCWGFGRQLGTDAATGDDRVVSPTAVLTSETFSQISVGLQHTCALNAQGAAFCWGRETAGTLGNGGNAVEELPTPTAVAGGLTFQHISASVDLTCALDTAGAVHCWGSRLDFRFGQTAASNFEAAPNAAASGLVASEIALGLDFGCAVDDRVYCWGGNRMGQTAQGLTYIADVPTRIAF